MLDDVIACPNPDHGELRREGDSYRCESCGATYAIRNGIPLLLPTGETSNGR